MCAVARGQNVPKGLPFNDTKISHLFYIQRKKMSSKKSIYSIFFLALHYIRYPLYSGPLTSAFHFKDALSVSGALKKTFI